MKTLYQDEEKAYRAYAELFNVPFKRDEKRDRFIDWRVLYKNLSPQDRAYMLIQRIAERFPPEQFICDDDGWANCIFCTADRDEQHEPDCIAVLIQEFAK